MCSTASCRKGVYLSEGCRPSSCSSVSTALDLNSNLTAVADPVYASVEVSHITAVVRAMRNTTPAASAPLELTRTDAPGRCASATMSVA